MPTVSVVDMNGEAGPISKRLAQKIRQTCDAGRQVSLLQSLAAPEGDWQRDTEVLRETISNTASALLTLVDVKSDPVTGREHNLLSTLIELDHIVKSSPFEESDLEG